jgi:hypothetical protein
MRSPVHMSYRTDEKRSGALSLARQVTSLKLVIG